MSPLLLFLSGLIYLSIIVFMLVAIYTQDLKYVNPFNASFFIVQLFYVSYLKIFFNRIKLSKSNTLVTKKIKKRNMEFSDYELVYEVHTWCKDNNIKYHVKDGYLFLRKDDLTLFQLTWM